MAHSLPLSLENARLLITDPGLPYLLHCHFRLQRQSPGAPSPLFTPSVRIYQQFSSLAFVPVFLMGSHVRRIYFVMVTGIFPNDRN